MNAVGNGLLALSGSVADDGGQRTLTLTGDGSGQLVLGGTASNTYTGGTYVEQGTLVANANGALPDDSPLVVGAGGTFVFDPTVTGAPASVVGDARPAGAPSAAGSAAAVPEPSAVVLLLAALWSATIYRRFRFRPKLLEG